jgi:hypothetical protein
MCHLSLQAHHNRQATPHATTCPTIALTLPLPPPPPTCGRQPRLAAEGGAVEHGTPRHQVIRG